MMRHFLPVIGVLLLALTGALCMLTCEKPVTPGGPSEEPDTTTNVDIQGVYYGYLTTDYYTLGRRTVSRIHITITPATLERNGCTCVYDIAIADSLSTYANVCAKGKSSRLTSDCIGTLYHDIFIGNGDGHTVTGIVERYRLQPPGSEVHYSTMSFDAELP